MTNALDRVRKEIKYANDNFYKPSTAMLDIRDRLVRGYTALEAVLLVHKASDKRYVGGAIACEGCTTSHFFVGYPCSAVSEISRVLGIYGEVCEGCKYPFDDPNGGCDRCEA